MAYLFFVKLCTDKPDDKKKEGRGISMEGGEGEIPLHVVHPSACQVTVDLNVETWSLNYEHLREIYNF